mgnify:CR=1 FL=1
MKYGYDVYKDNARYKNVNDRYFEYEVIGFDYPYEELHFSLFDKTGNKIESVEGGRIGVRIRTPQFACLISNIAYVKKYHES